MSALAGFLNGMATGITDRKDREARERELAAYEQAVRGGMTGAPGVKDVASGGDGARLVHGHGPTSYQDAIASIESAGSGDYAAIGPTDNELGRALGRYQVMEVNIGPWSKAALGREVSVDEFMKSPEIQDAIFDHRFGLYVDKYGPEGAAQAWFGGEGGVGKAARSDALGTTVGDYGKRFVAAIGGAAPPPRDAAGVKEAAAKRGTWAWFRNYGGPG